MTLRQLRSLGEKWIERLRLQDWNITFRFATKEESKEAWGLAFRDHHDKAATIVIVNPSDPAWSSGDHHRDPEVILLHELIHVHFAPFAFRIGSPQHTTEENIVNQVARLLVALERGDEGIINGGRPLSKRARIPAWVDADK